MVFWTPFLCSATIRSGEEISLAMENKWSQSGDAGAPAKPVATAQTAERNAGGNDKPRHQGADGKGKTRRGKRGGARNREQREEDTGTDQRSGSLSSSSGATRTGSASSSTDKGGQPKEQQGKDKGARSKNLNARGQASKTNTNTNNSALPGAADTESGGGSIVHSDQAASKNSKKKDQNFASAVSKAPPPSLLPMPPQHMLQPQYPQQPQHHQQPHQYQQQQYLQQQQQFQQQQQWSSQQKEVMKQLQQSSDRLRQHIPMQTFPVHPPNPQFPQQLGFQQQQHQGAAAAGPSPSTLASLAYQNLDPRYKTETASPSMMGAPSVTARALGAEASPRTNREGNQNKRKNAGKKNQQGRGQAGGQGQGGQGKRGNQTQQHQHYEEHISKEEATEKLKRKELIKGIIRINPRNFEDAYVPLPDGTADVYIPGMQQRNRALNGDVVAVEIFPRNKWRVYMDDLDLYEAEAKSLITTEKGETASLSDGDDSGPDALIESVEPWVDENMKLGDQAVSGANNLSQSLAAMSVGSPAVSANLPVAPAPSRNSSASSLAGSSVTDCSSTRSASSTPCKQRPGSGKPRSQSGSTPRKEGPGPRKEGGKQGGNNKYRYSSLEELLSTASPVAQELFNSDPSHTDHKERTAKADKFLQRTGKVVHIVEEKHSRYCSGFLKYKNNDCAIFSPLDHRMPRLQIFRKEMPKGFLQRPNDFSKILFIAKIKDWFNQGQNPTGEMIHNLGEAGEIEPETLAILVQNDIDYNDFDDKCLEGLPRDLPWRIPDEEFGKRRDFRQKCVFTIDPSTARDLDDALSIDELEDGNFEVGVHIADVSFFLHEGTPLDKVASKRATSVYLVQRVIPMLPRLLCEQLCSLNPDEDRLTFSVVWKMTPDAVIEEEWFGRSIIRSCAKLSYDHAQGFIEEPDRVWTRDELPPITNGFDVKDVHKRTLLFHRLAQKLRQRRFDGGALRLDQVKLQFTLDGATGTPNGYCVFEQRDSNKLVEEFMLLANMAVAAKIHKTFPELALLRRHPAPQTKMMEDLKNLSQDLGVPLDTSSAGALQASLRAYAGNDDFQVARMQILVALCSKPMQNAQYFCTGTLLDEEEYHHYALNVPRYTHFTSPIRRYPDVLVHRLLGAALKNNALPDLSPEQMQSHADHCNEKKFTAKRASEMSNELFFSVFVKTSGPLEETAMVMGVMDRSFDVFVLRLGVVKRVYCQALDLQSYELERDKRKLSLKLRWNATQDLPPIEQTISIFSVVTCWLETESQKENNTSPLKWNATIKRPAVE